MEPQKKQKVIDFLVENYEALEMVSIGNAVGIKKSKYYSMIMTEEQIAHKLMDLVAQRGKEKEMLEYMSQKEDFQRDGLDILIQEIFTEVKPVEVKPIETKPEQEPESQKTDRPVPPTPEIYTELKKGLKAIIIGVEKYTHYPVRCYLPGAKGDALRIAEFLQKDWGMKPEDVHVFTGDEENGAVDYQKTLDEIRRICADEVSSDNNLLFYFAGHGTEINGDSYLLMSDYASHLNPKERENKIKMQILNDIVKECQAKIKIRIFDCCHCGETIVRDGLDDMAVEEVMTERMLDDFMGKGNGWITFCSCNVNESAYDIAGHGIFTDALLEGLRGKARRGEGNLYIEDLKIHVCNVVPPRAKQCEDRYRKYDGEQHPQYKCEIDGNILVE